MTDEQLPNPEQLVHAYYETLKDRTASFDETRLREILAPDLAFEGPITGRRVGAEGFIKGVAGFASTMHGITMLQQLLAGDAAATLYDAEMPGGTVRFAEFFLVADGRIQSLRLLFDKHEYQTRGGR
jgi:hypothetical protein